MIDKKQKLLKKYSTIVKKLKRFPTGPELHKNGITSKTIEWNFGNMGDIKVKARKEYPEFFKDIIDYEVWNYDKIKEIKEIIKHTNKFIITTAVSNCPINKKFLKSIESYCKINKSELLILVANNDVGNIDSELSSKNIIFDDMKLNSNLFISTIKLSPKQTDPSTGLHRIAKNKGSFIFASPKQRLKYEPTSGEISLPRCLMTTGAITYPKYEGKKYIQRKSDYLATADHKIGGIIVELKDNSHFHFRQIQSDKSGGFHDLGKYYDLNGVKKSPAEAIVYGDWHSGDTDPIVKESWEKLAKETNAKTLVLHDAFNGTSINHHESKDNIEKSIKSKRGALNLKNEILGLSNDLLYLSKIYDKIIIVKSNHDLFLNRYLREGKYIDDYENHYYSLDLAKKLIDGEDPLKWATEQNIDSNIKKKIIWLTEDSKITIEGIEIGNHGHRGPNGTRGSIVSLERVAYKSIIGHLHTPGILREIWQVGTSTKLKLNYNPGPSSWCQTCCIIYSGGSRQMINCINGEYKI